MDLKATQKIVEDFIVGKGDYVVQNWHSMSIEKLKDGGVDVCTNFDIEIEKAFSDFVNTNYPDCGFRGEEDAQLNKLGEYIWMIDPIDGTKFFAAGIPLWCLTVSLVDAKGEGLIGVIYNPVSKQLYSASKDNGAFLNGSPIELNHETDISKLQVSIDISATKIDDIDLTDRCHKVITTLEKHFYRARMLGSGALSLAWLSQGFFGAFVDPVRPEKKLIDTAGGLCIAKEAGAVVQTVQIAEGIYSTVVARDEVINIINQLI